MLAAHDCTSNDITASEMLCNQQFLYSFFVFYPYISNVASPNCKGFLVLSSAQECSMLEVQNQMPLLCSINSCFGTGQHLLHLLKNQMLFRQTFLAHATVPIRTMIILCAVLGESTMSVLGQVQLTIKFRAANNHKSPKFDEIPHFHPHNSNLHRYYISNQLHIVC